GTSLSAPCWAGLIAIADQGRVAAGANALTGRTQTLPALYSLGVSNPGDFRDITLGNNGYGAQAGYDLVTGLGTPIADALVPALAQYGLTKTAFTSSANPSVNDQLVTFTATVTSLLAGVGTPTGSVQFVIDGKPQGSPVPLSAGGVASTKIV